MSTAQLRRSEGNDNLRQAAPLPWIGALHLLPLVALPTCRHSLSLYASVTAIRWDYDAAPEVAVKGCELLHCNNASGTGVVSTHSLSQRTARACRSNDLPAPTSCFFVLAADIAPPNGAPVKPFHFDPRLMNEKQIADALWDSIGEAWSGV
jgi:hypothetical protein